jgi:hypothetical protein
MDLPSNETATTPPPHVDGGQDITAWVGGSNVVTDERRTHPESTWARRPTDFKSAAEIEKRATQGLPEDRRLSLNEKTSNITLTSWVNALRAYCEEHGMDTVFRIYNSDTDSEMYFLKDWGLASSEKVVEWETTLTTGVGDAPPCDTTWRITSSGVEKLL